MNIAGNIFAENMRRYLQKINILIKDYTDRQGTDDAVTYNE